MIITPSILAHGLNGLTLLVVIIMAITNYQQLSSLSFYQLLLVALLFNIAIGVHSISHSNLEYYYHLPKPWNIKLTPS